MTLGVNTLAGSQVQLSSYIQLAVPLSVMLMPFGLFVNSTPMLLYSLAAFKFIACCVQLWDATGTIAFIGVSTAIIWACTGFIMGVTGTIQMNQKTDDVDKWRRQNK